MPVAGDRNWYGENRAASGVKNLRASARKPRAIFGNLGRDHPGPAPRGLFLRLVQQSLYLAVMLVGRADALPIELKALVD